MIEKDMVSVIMPAYNEEKRIGECFHRVLEVLKEYGQPFEVILEEDGSTDRTPQIMDELVKRYPFVKALHFPTRRGKGFGIRMGVEVSTGGLIVLIDSDMEYPPEKIPCLLGGLNDADIVVGGRMEWKNYRTRVWRRLSSITYISLLKVLFKTDGLCDPQSGFKAYKREVIEAVSPLSSKGFEIDTEILLKALKKGYTVKYLPITYTYKGNSKVDMLGDPLRMFLSVLRWKINGKIGEGENLKQSYAPLPRKDIENEASRFDQGEIGYKSRNPLVRTFFNRKIQAITKCALDAKSQHILDVGCGDGLVLEKLQAEFLVGLDLSLTRLKRARLRVKNGLFLCGDAEYLPFRESSFDLVMCLDTLEHLPNPHNCVRNLESSTAKGGIIIVSVPDDRMLSFARLLTARYPFCLKGHGHVHNLKPEEIAKLFKNSGLLSSRKVPTGLLPIITLLCMKPADNC